MTDCHPLLLVRGVPRVVADGLAHPVQLQDIDVEGQEVLAKMAATLEMIHSGELKPRMQTVVYFWRPSWMKVLATVLTSV